MNRHEEKEIMPSDRLKEKNYGDKNSSTEDTF